MKVLIVDDSPIIHNLLGRVLTANGHQVCGNAKNGKEGVTMFQELSPDLIFMDITMPVMDGLEAAKQIKGIDCHAKIIMFSAMGDEEIAAQAESIGIDVFLKKPFDDYKIISAIAKII